MTIHHHPADDLLTAYAAGTLDRGQHVAIATHLAGCERCRQWARAMEHVGGVVLAQLPAARMSSGALARAEAMLAVTMRMADMMPARSDTAWPAGSARPATTALDDVPGLPAYVRRLPVGSWRWVAPQIHMRPITVADSGATRVFLLRAGPGTSLLQHSHSGVEMTCVLSGSFSHEGGRFGPGDFDIGDDAVEHQPVVDAGQGCICLIAMDGQVRLKGLIGRLMQPFVRL